MIHLDTSFLIRALVAGSAEASQLRGWIVAGDTVSVAAPAWAEFLCGPLETGEVAAAGRLLGPPVPFGSDEALETARLFNVSGRRRGSLLDCMVAATAVCAGALLATSNPADFHRLVPAGLKLTLG